MCIRDSTSGGAAAGSVTYTNSGDSDASTWTATYTVADSHTDGAVAFTLDFADLAGNSGTQVTAVTNGGGSVTIDTTIPQAESFTMNDYALKSGDEATVTLTFSEAVTGFSSGDDITVQNGSLTTMTSNDNGITWTGTFTPTADVTDTTNVLSLATSYTDLAGNEGNDSETDNYEVDTSSSCSMADLVVLG